MLDSPGRDWLASGEGSSRRGGGGGGGGASHPFNPQALWGLPPSAMSRTPLKCCSSSPCPSGMLL